MKANSLPAAWAAIRIQQADKHGHGDLLVAKGLANMLEVRPLLRAIAREIDDEKLAAVAASVADIEDQRERESIRCRRKATDRQLHVLALALLEKFGTAREIVKAGWGLTDQQIDEAEA
jgi:hypothetical protein